MDNLISKTTRRRLDIRTLHHTIKHVLKASKWTTNSSTCITETSCSSLLFFMTQRIVGSFSLVSSYFDANITSAFTKLFYLNSLKMWEKIPQSRQLTKTKKNWLDGKKFPKGWKIKVFVNWKLELACHSYQCLWQVFLTGQLIH